MEWNTFQVSWNTKRLSTSQLTVTVLHISVVQTEQSVALNVKGLVIL
jgi:hypothetical protein